MHRITEIKFHNIATSLSGMVNFSHVFYKCAPHIRFSFIIDEQGDKFAMYIALPQKVDGLEQLLQKVNRSTWARALKSMAKAKVKVALPKIKFSNSISLKDTMNIVSRMMHRSRRIFGKFHCVSLNFRWEFGKFSPTRQI